MRFACRRGRDGAGTRSRLSPASAETTVSRSRLEREPQQCPACPASAAACHQPQCDEGSGTQGEAWGLGPLRALCVVARYSGASSKVGLVGWRVGTLGGLGKWSFH